MSRRKVTFCLLIFATILAVGLCVPTGSASHSSNVPKISNKVGKSGKSLNKVTIENKENPVKSASNETQKPEFSLSKDFFSWSSMEDMFRQVVVASNAVEHLEKMKTKLLNQFDKKTGDFATARGGYGGYGAYGFPSLEGALLSIAFLTFGVFLIDLIQQLLSRVRTGTVGVVPLVGRGKRSLVPEDEYDPMMGLTTSVLSSIEAPVFKM